MNSHPLSGWLGNTKRLSRLCLIINTIKVYVYIYAYMYTIINEKSSLEFENENEGVYVKV